MDKPCPHCNEFLPIDEFGTRMMNGVERLQSWCKSCRAGSSGPFEITRTAPEPVLAAACSLKSPPTPIAKELFYLDGNKTTKYGEEIDRQRQKAYDAENATNLLEDLGSFDDPSEVEETLRSMVTSTWFKNRFGAKPSLTVEVNRPSSKRGPYKQASEVIFLNAKTMYAKTLIHELAHACVPHPHAWHGPLWCAIYLMLLDKFAGSKYAEVLRCSFEEHGVQYKPYPKLRVQGGEE